MNQADASILWHDYETWGTRPMVDFPVQFAAIRTNIELEPIQTETPINIMCKIPHDYLPHPQACLITGITPQLSLQKGLSEPEFARRIFEQMSKPQTCVVGYNSMRFDEEVTRHMLFRNLFPVYEREYKNGNSRWDIIDLVRACYALRPNGIEWAYNENDSPSFKLESLAKANNIEHRDAHDALSDVRATIAIAALIKNAQPKLYNYYWSMRNKHKVKDLLQQYQANIYVYVGPYINSLQACCTLIMPICEHPETQNAVICVDLSKPIDLLLQDSPVKLQEALFAKEQTFVDKPGLIAISVNKCPFIAPFKTLSSDRAKSLNIDMAACLKNYKILSNNPRIAILCQQTFMRNSLKEESIDVDKSLYTSDFPSLADTRMMKRIRSSLPEQLEAFRGEFESPTLNEVLARYIARNYPGLLSEVEMRLWQQHLNEKLSSYENGENLSLQAYFSEINDLQNQHANHMKNLAVLTALNAYGKELMS